MQDSPTRGDNLFADAMEYDDKYDSLAKGMNGLSSQWDENGKDAPPKASNPRRSIRMLHDQPDDLDKVMNGDSPSVGGGPQLRQVPHSWGSLLNGHLPNPADARQEASEPVDSWESLAPDEDQSTMER